MVDHSDEILNILGSTESTPTYAPPLSDAVALSFSQLLSGKFDKEKLNLIKDKYGVPENCKIMGVPKTNMEIWNVIPPRAKSVDLMWQGVQSSISIALVIQARIFEILLKSNGVISMENKRTLANFQMDAAHYLASAMKEITLKRKTQLKPCLPVEIQGICNTQAAVSENLFGENLTEQIKLLKSTSTLLKGPVIRTQPNFRTSRYRPYNRPQITQRQSLNPGRPSLRGQGTFRGRKGRSFPPHRQQ